MNHLQRLVKTSSLHGLIAEVRQKRDRLCWLFLFWRSRALVDWQLIHKPSALFNISVGDKPALPTNVGGKIEISQLKGVSDQSNLPAVDRFLRRAFILPIFVVDAGEASGDLVIKHADTFFAAAATFHWKPIDSSAWEDETAFGNPTNPTQSWTSMPLACCSQQN